MKKVNYIILALTLMIMGSGCGAEKDKESEDSFVYEESNLDVSNNSEDTSEITSCIEEDISESVSSQIEEPDTKTDKTEISIPDEPVQMEDYKTEDLIEMDIESAQEIATLFNVNFVEDNLSIGTYTSESLGGLIPENFMYKAQETLPKSVCTPEDTYWIITVNEDGVNLITLNGIEIWPDVSVYRDYMSNILICDVSLSENNEKNVYTKENLIDGIYIINGDSFEKIDLNKGLPDGFLKTDELYTQIYTDVKSYNPSAFPTISTNTVFAMKGEPMWTNIDKVKCTGYTYNCQVTDWCFISSPNKLKEKVKDKDYITEDKIRKINDIEMTFDDFINEKISEGMVWFSNELLIGDERFLNDKFKVGYFDNTDFVEKEFEIKYWVATGKDYHFGSPKMEVTETYDGYFELRFPKDQNFESGLYVIYFGYSPYYVWLE